MIQDSIIKLAWLAAAVLFAYMGLMSMATAAFIIAAVLVVIDRPLTSRDR